MMGIFALSHKYQAGRQAGREAGRQAGRQESTIIGNVLV